MVKIETPKTVRKILLGKLERDFPTGALVILKVTQPVGTYIEFECKELATDDIWTIVSFPRNFKELTDQFGDETDNWPQNLVVQIQHDTRRNIGFLVQGIVVKNDRILGV